MSPPLKQYEATKAAFKAWIDAQPESPAMEFVSMAVHNQLVKFEEDIILRCKHGFDTDYPKKKLAELQHWFEEAVKS